MLPNLWDISEPQTAVTWPLQAAVLQHWWVMSWASSCAFSNENIPPRASIYLKLCDGSVADLSSRGRIFTPVESFHFVVQLPDKVYLQRAGAWGRANTGETLCSFPTTKEGIFLQSSDGRRLRIGASYLSVECWETTGWLSHPRFDSWILLRWFLKKEYRRISQDGNALRGVI